MGKSKNSEWDEVEVIIRKKAGRMLSLPLSYRLTDKNIRIFRIMIIILILIIIIPFIKLKGENLLPIDFCGQTGYS